MSGGVSAAPGGPGRRWLSRLVAATGVLPHETGAQAMRLDGPLAALAAQPFRLALLFCLAYLALDAGTALFAVEPTKWTPWNPQAALAVTLVASAGLRFFPVVMVAVLLAEIVVRGAPAGTASLLTALAIASTYSAAGYLLRHFTRWTRAGVTVRDLTALVAIAFATSLAVAVLLATAHALAGTVALNLLHLVSFQVVVGEALGMIVAMPALLLAVSGAWRVEAATTLGRGRLGRELAILALVLAALLLLIFWWRPLDEFRMSYLLFLPMVVVAIRHGLFGAALAVPIAQVGLIAAVAVFSPRAATAFEFQMLTLALALTSLYLGLLSSERERDAQRLADRERELREQRSALNDAQRAAATSELAAALAHDLNQPLSAIGTYARAARLLAERDGADRDKLLHTLTRIGDESARAGQYVRRMRDFFRTGVMHSEAVPIEQLIERGRAHLRDRLERADIRFETVVEPGLPPLRTDAVQAGAVLDNLLGNACDALAEAPPPRRIRVTAARLPGAEQPTLRITVQDSGPGVPSELQPQLFRPLATTKPQGMGLGLALSRSIAERLGGRLSFDGTAAVTTFYLDLPIHEQRTQ